MVGLHSDGKHAAVTYFGVVALDRCLNDKEALGTWYSIRRGDPRLASC